MSNDGMMVAVSANEDRREWMSYFDQLKSYREIHGHPHMSESCGVNASLSKWVCFQRLRYRKPHLYDPLTPQQIEVLNSLQFVWKLESDRKEQNWEHQYRILTTSAGTSAAPTTQAWISAQRRLHQLGKLRHDRRVRLQQAGVNFGDEETEGEPNTEDGFAIGAMPSATSQENQEVGPSPCKSDSSTIQENYREISENYGNTMEIRDDANAVAAKSKNIANHDSTFLFTSSLDNLDHHVAVAAAPNNPHDDSKAPNSDNGNDDNAAVDDDDDFDLETPTYDLGTQIIKYASTSSTAAAAADGQEFQKGEVVSWDGTYYRIRYENNEGVEDEQLEEHDLERLVMILNPPIEQVQAGTRIAICFDKKFLPATVRQKTDSKVLIQLVDQDANASKTKDKQKQHQQQHWVNLTKYQFHLRKTLDHEDTAPNDAASVKPKRGRPRKSEAKRKPGRPRKTPEPPQDVSTTPTKRKPGRPRKKPSPLVETNIKEEDIKSPPKRKPGRPRKHPSPAKVQDIGVVDGKTVVLVKRGPGRPRKSDSKAKAECEYDSDVKPASPKRKPGRPRKKPTASGDVPKRKPGRPRKSETVQQGGKETAIVPKRKPGRPRKTQPTEAEDKASASTTTDAISLKKRKPGRPRKSDCLKEEDQQRNIMIDDNTVPKRKRGRPRKSVTGAEGKLTKKQRSSSAEPLDKTAVMESGANNKPVRKRGRPPKAEAEVEAREPHRKMGLSSEVDVLKYNMDFKEPEIIGVGCRIALFWDEDGQFFEGMITRERFGKRKKYFLQYDDNDTEWVDLEEEKFYVIEAGIANNTQSKSESRVRVGNRISIYWEDDETYYAGMIIEQRFGKKKNFLVHYDDGEQEWVDLSDEQFLLLSERGAAGTDAASLRSSDAARNGLKTATSNKREVMRQKGRTNPQDDCTEWHNGSRPKDAHPIKHVMIFQSANSTEMRGLPDSTADDGDYDNKQISIVSLDESNNTRDGSMTPEWCSSAGEDTGSLEEDKKSLSVAVGVGSRVSIYWKGDDKYYDGIVTRVRSTDRKSHFVEYHDGDREWVDLSTERIKLWSDHNAFSNEARGAPSGGADYVSTDDDDEENEWRDPGSDDEDNDF